MTGATANLAASITAALATAALAVIAIFQWHEMKEQREQERDRWVREDNQRKPRAIFWIQNEAKTGAAELWCANLGIVNFLVSGLRVISLDGKSKTVLFETRKIFIVSVGQMTHIALRHPEVLFGSERPGNCEIKLILEGPTGPSDSDSKAYHLWFYEGRYIMRDPEKGFQGFLMLRCPKCDFPVANFDTGGLTSREDCIRQIEAAEERFSQTCPNHEPSGERIQFPQQIPDSITPYVIR